MKKIKALFNEITIFFFLTCLWIVGYRDPVEEIDEENGYGALAD